ncbi:hypothetical protein ACFRMQ_01950 [Kitasatospora sp. NPDC056783]|uniref:hypothetical protein n=1 Tax=Kitasatospora sp. NPDC056783 TaxID=3345943 RepID=UPI0036BF9D00
MSTHANGDDRAEHGATDRRTDPDVDAVREFADGSRLEALRMRYAFIDGLVRAVLSFAASLVDLID